MHQPWMGEMVRATIANTQRDIRDLVTLTEVGKEGLLRGSGALRLGESRHLEKGSFCVRSVCFRC